MGEKAKEAWQRGLEGAQSRKRRRILELPVAGPPWGTLQTMGHTANDETHCKRWTHCTKWDTLWVFQIEKQPLDSTTKQLNRGQE